jgi:very-short-patch-repair endonuclease
VRFTSLMASRSIQRARKLRKTMSPPEIALWVQLREFRKEGWHFRRQSPEGPYILDFVCRAAKLVIEVDGIHHSGDEQSDADKVRDAFLLERGFRVTRVSAADVGHELDGVIQDVRTMLGARAPASEQAAPQLKGGRRYNHLVRLGLRRRAENA